MLRFFLKRRKVKNYISSTRLKINYHLRLGIIAFLFITPLILYFSSIAKEMLLQISFLTQADPVAASQLTSDVQHLMIMFSLAFFIFFCLSLAIILLLEQRVGGPTVAVLKMIDEIKNGNYSYRRKLRKRDELDIIMDSLVDLQTVLQEKEAGKHST